MIDLQSFPATGGALLAVAIYGGVSLFITGPIVGERMIMKSEWPSRCSALVVAEAQQRAAPPPIASVDCDTVIGILMPELRALCEPVDQIAGDIERQQRNIEAQRLSYATKDTVSRCDCAAGLTLEENRTGLALHAGSLRLITPHGVKTLNSRLESALGAPLCAAKR
jgi:hypothetical protein